MANLDVQPKKQSPLPWIILAVVVAALAIWFFTRDSDGGDASADPADTAVSVQPAP